MRSDAKITRISVDKVGVRTETLGDSNGRVPIEPLGEG